MADIKVEITVVVKVGECGGGGPVTIPIEAGLSGDILEGSVPFVVIKSVTSPTRDKEVGLAVVIDVSDGHAVAIAARKGGQSRLLGDVFKGSVASVAEELVSLVFASGTRGKRSSLNEINVDISV